MRRWRQRIDKGDVIESPHGEFVLHEDAQAEIRELQAQVDCSVTPYELQVERLKGLILEHACTCGSEDNKDPVEHLRWCPYRHACLPEPLEKP